MTIDFASSDDGSITILRPLTGCATDWCEEYLPEDCPRWGLESYAIESNCFGLIRQGILSDGLTINTD